MTGQFGERRWFQRPGDGLIFSMADLDHIQRMLSEGWLEVDGPDARDVPTSPPDMPPAVPPDTIQARNNAALEAFGLTPKPQRPPAKPIRTVKETTKER